MEINIFQKQDYRNYLAAILEKRCLKNPQYSLRAFARDIDVAVGFLSLLLNRKRSLSLVKAKRIAEYLDFQDHEREYFLALVDKDRTGDGSRVFELRQRYAFESLGADDKLAKDMTLKEFALFQQISLLGRLQETKAHAEMLSLTLDEMRLGCRRLHELGWITGSPETGWISQGALMRTEADEKSENIRLFHQKVLEMGLKQLHEGEVDERYFNSLIFSFSAEQYEEFCRELNAFCLARCDAYSSRDSHDRIYSLGVQLLPIASLKRKVSRYSDGHGRTAEYMKKPTE